MVGVDRSRRHTDQIRRVRYTHRKVFDGYTRESASHVWGPKPSCLVFPAITFQTCRDATRLVIVGAFSYTIFVHILRRLSRSEEYSDRTRGRSGIGLHIMRYAVTCL